jgi:hypothetical protein
MKNILMLSLSVACCASQLECANAGPAGSLVKLKNGAMVPQAAVQPIMNTLRSLWASRDRFKKAAVTELVISVDDPENYEKNERASAEAQASGLMAADGTVSDTVKAILLSAFVYVPVAPGQGIEMPSLGVSVKAALIDPIALESDRHIPVDDNGHELLITSSYK